VLPWRVRCSSAAHLRSVNSSRTSNFAELPFYEVR
jgi:hypothetical protein